MKSSARRLGPRAPTAVAGFYAAAVILALAAGLSAGLGLLFFLGLAAYALHLGWQSRRVRVEDPARALTLFKSNTWAGGLLAATLLAGAIS